MYLFFSRISKLSARRGNSIPVMLRQSPPVSYLHRFESTQASALTDLTGTALTGRFPCLWGGTEKNWGETEILRQIYYDPTKEKKLLSGEQKYPDGYVPHRRTELMGVSYGWVLRTDGVQVYLTDMYKPWVSSPRVILLPSLDIEVGSLCKNSLSLSSDPDEGDFCVATKFNEAFISVCRLCDSKWTHIKLPKFLLSATLMYSKGAKTFFFTSSNDVYLGLLDLENNKIKCRSLQLLNVPKISDAGWRVLRKCILTKHLVDSPSGELIFIKWYTNCIVDHDPNYYDTVKIYPLKPKRFMVFREDETSRNFYHTKDIGDLCIFLGENEAFCVSASMYPGLRPNSIYYVNRSGVGRYSINSGKIRSLVAERVFERSHWISPS